MLGAIFGIAVAVILIIVLVFVTIILILNLINRKRSDWGQINYQPRTWDDTAQAELDRKQKRS